MDGLADFFMGGCPTTATFNKRMTRPASPLLQPPPKNLPDITWRFFARVSGYPPTLFHMEPDVRGSWKTIYPFEACPCQVPCQLVDFPAATGKQGSLFSPLEASPPPTEPHLNWDPGQTWSPPPFLMPSRAGQQDLFHRLRKTPMTPGHRKTNAVGGVLGRCFGEMCRKTRNTPLLGCSQIPC